MDDATVAASWARVALIPCALVVLWNLARLIAGPEWDHDPAELEDEICDGCPWFEAQGCSAACL